MNESVYSSATKTSQGLSSNVAVSDRPVEHVPMGALAPGALQAAAPLVSAGVDPIVVKPSLSPARVESFNSLADVVELDSLDIRNLNHKLSMVSTEMAAMFNEVIDLISMIYQGNRVLLAQQAEAVQKAAKAAIDQATEAAKAGVIGKIFGWIGRIFSIIFLTLASVALSATSPVLALLTITALVLTVMDLCSAVCQEVGGPDISYAGLMAMVAQACGATQQTGDAIRQWLGLSVQVVTIVIGVIGGGAAASKMAELLGKALIAVVDLLSGVTAVGAGGSSIYTGAEKYKLALAEIEEMKVNAYHERLSQVVKQWGDDLLAFMQWLDDFIKQRYAMVSQQQESNKQLLES